MSKENFYPSNVATVPFALFNLEQLELDGKPLTARAELEQRLIELSQGRPVPIVAFNCLEFSWIPNGNRYPQSIVSGDATTSICRFFQDEIEIVKLDLQQVGNPLLRIVIPDSELFDNRVFSFAQTTDERTQVAQAVKNDLASALCGLDDEESPVIFWSDYCKEQGIASPMEYTSQNFERIKSDPKLFKKVKDQIGDSKIYLEKNGLPGRYIKNIRESELLERTLWYCAMYAGEGQALFESGAIVLNFEDGRVPAWFQRGADNRLPMLTPGDPRKFYAWRRSMKPEQS